MIVLISVAVLMLSSTLVLRLSATYVYHFNDSQAVLDIPYSVKGGEMADGISSYLRSFGDEAFQVYEDNGMYKDPLFNLKEKEVMRKVRTVLNLEMGLGMIALGFFVAIYIYLYKRNSTRLLRYTGRGAVATLSVLIIVRAVLACIKTFRGWLYQTLIGIELEKDSLLIQVLGDPMFKTYVLFATVVAVVFTGIYAYVNAILAKQKRIFY